MIARKTREEAKVGRQCPATDKEIRRHRVAATGRIEWTVGRRELAGLSKGDQKLPNKT